VANVFSLPILVHSFLTLPKSSGASLKQGVALPLLVLPLFAPSTKKVGRFFLLLVLGKRCASDLMMSKRADLNCYRTVEHPQASCSPGKERGHWGAGEHGKVGMRVQAEVDVN